MPPLRHRAEPWAYDRVLYRRRNEVERFFCRLKRFRRVAASYHKLDAVYLAIIYDALQLT